MYGSHLWATRKNGITLIALIITIIVMLILVGVTINVALNGGLFLKAANARNLTQKEADREELLSAVYGTLNKVGDLQLETKTKLEENLPEGWDVEASTENTNYFECTSPKGTILYVNKDTGKILDELPQETNPWKLLPRNLTSTRVVYDQSYIRQENNGFVSEIIFYGNGKLLMNSEWDNDSIDNFFSSNVFVIDSVDSNCLLFDATSFGGFYIAFVFENNNTMTAYIVDSTSNQQFSKSAIVQNVDTTLHYVLTTSNP